jgi:hypothetical protein
MQRFKALTVETLTASETKPTRVKICDNKAKQTVIIAKEKSLHDTIIEYLEGKTEICGYCPTKNGYIVLVSETFNLKG